MAATTGEFVPQKPRYRDLVFEADFSSARRGELPPIHFTRMERVLLEEFTSSRGRLLGREHLLQALSGHGADTSDRSVDFLVNRLRRKLGDDARRPRFIATRYGEGYAWVATPADAEAAASALVVIGPVYGLSASAAAPGLMQRLGEALDAGLGAGGRVCVAPEWSARSADTAVRFHVETALHRVDDALHAAFVLRETGRPQPLEALRFEFDDAATASLDDAAETLKAAIWRHAAVADGRIAGVAAQPVYLHMHDAAQLLALSPEYWLQNEAQLRQAREDDPHDPRLAVLYASNRLTYSLLSFGDNGMMEPAARNAVESEAESLLLGAIDGLQDQPNYLLAAAKLLLMLGNRHLALAERLVERAFRIGTSFAAVFAVQAQIHAVHGDTERALELYDRALPMSEPGSEFRVYLLVLKACALLAAGQDLAMQRVTRELYREKPLARMQLGIQFTPADESPDPDLAQLLAGMGAQRTAQLLRHAYYMGARRMRSAAQRENMMRGTIRHAVRHYGTDVVPDDLRALLPGLSCEWNAKTVPVPSDAMA